LLDLSEIGMTMLRQLGAIEADLPVFDDEQEPSQPGIPEDR
jgi:hypothetical protein